METLMVLFHHLIFHTDNTKTSTLNNSVQCCQVNLVLLNQDLSFLPNNTDLDQMAPEEAI